MYEDLNNNNYNNYGSANENLESQRKKYKRIRMTSPVLIQSYGKNNFAFELINNIKKNINEQNYNENNSTKIVLKKVKRYKTNTNFTEISPYKNNTFYNSQRTKPLAKYYKNFR